MWPNWKARQAELFDKADFFEYAGYANTSKWVRHLAGQVAVKRPVTDLEKDLDETVAAYRAEYVQDDKDKNILFATVFKVMFDSLKSGGALEQELGSVMPTIRELIDNSQNMNPLIKAFSGYRQDPEMHYFGMCFLYLLNVEGVFDQAIRVLFVLISRLKGVPVPREKVDRMTLKELREGMDKLSVPQILFDGWNNHVRNAIAHCRFRYNRNLDKMTFVDLGSPPKTLSRADFSKLTFKLDDVWHSIQNLIFMLRITQLVLARDVPRAGKDLIIRRNRQ